MKKRAKPATQKRKRGTPRRADKGPGVATDTTWHERFLRVYEKERCITTACDAAGISRSTFYEHEKLFPDFATAVVEANERGADALEQCAVLRATTGVPRKKFTAKGAPVIDPKTGEQYVEYEQSDALLLFLLKHQRSEKYGVDKSKVEVSGGVTVTEEGFAEKLRRSASARETLRKLLAEAGGAK